MALKSILLDIDHELKMHYGDLEIEINFSVNAVQSKDKYKHVLVRSYAGIQSKLL